MFFFGNVLEVFIVLKNDVQYSKGSVEMYFKSALEVIKTMKMK